MHNITLLCTHHSEFGKCNSYELYKIIESIRPDVIFEELPQDLFDICYKENLLPDDVPPEIKSVKRYLQNYLANHIPVDIKLSATLSSDEIHYVFNAVGKYAVYSNLEEEQKKWHFKKVMLSSIAKKMRN